MGKCEMVKDVHTSTAVPVPLFSFDDMYATGDWDFLMRDESRGGAAFIKYGDKGEQKHNIPLTYDWENKCTWVDYIVGGNIRGSQKSTKLCQRTPTSKRTIQRFDVIRFDRMSDTRQLRRQVR